MFAPSYPDLLFHPAIIGLHCVYTCIVLLFTVYIVCTVHGNGTKCQTCCWILTIKIACFKFCKIYVTLKLKLK